MSLKDYLPKGVLDAIFEEDGESQPKQSPPALIPPHPFSVPTSQGQSSFSTSTASITPTPIPVDNPLLTDLRTRTSFESTPLGQQLQGFITALDDTGLPETQKLKTALKLSHITAPSVIDTLNGLLTLLAADKQKFDAQMSAGTTTEVNGRQQKMANLDSQINDLESQLNALRANKSTLGAEIDSKTRQIQTLKDNYKAAFDLRSSEISTQIAHYQSILQG